MYKVGFGKHKDKTLEWLFFNDPGYVWWMLDNGAEERLYGHARTRFDKLVQRARHLAVPGHCAHCSQTVSTMSLTRHISGGLARVDFFCRECHHDGGSSVLTTPAFYTPDFFRNYDKRGGKFLVDAIKYRYFGGKVRMTQARMEEFFDDPHNFENP